jgi:hypothetical protein
MIEEQYNVKNDFETFLFITMTEESIRRAKMKGYGFYDWCKYLRKYIFAVQPSITSTKDLGLVAQELDYLDSSISEMYGLTIKETAKYFMIYFTYELWEKYYEYVAAKQLYFGGDSINKYNNNNIF